jgi:hypothetical protein
MDLVVDPGPASRKALACRRKFLRFFRKGFQDPKYVDWERGHKEAAHEERFVRFGETLATLPRRLTRVHTWPVQTVFGFIARPDRDIFLKPVVTRNAAEAYGFPFEYRSRPSWPTYAGLLGFAEALFRDLQDLRPRDLIDIQSFVWVLGSSEYE